MRSIRSHYDAYFDPTEREAITVTSYRMIQNLPEMALDWNWGLVILDESEGLYECHLTLTLARTHTLAWTPTLALPPTLGSPASDSNPKALTRSPHANPNLARKRALKLKPGCAINVLSQMAFMLKQKKEARKKRREGAKEGEKADDHGLDDHHGLLVHLPHRGHLFTCLTIRCFRPSGPRRTTTSITC